MNNMNAKTVEKLIKAYGKNQRRIGSSLGFGTGVLLMAISAVAAGFVSAMYYDIVESEQQKEDSGE